MIIMIIIIIIIIPILLWKKLVVGGVGNLWIGLSETRSKNQYEWIDNSKVTFTNWFISQPNNRDAPDEGCVSMNTLVSKLVSNGSCW